jgi:glycosyltransferase involved in cell wall biosynthesis
VLPPGQSTARNAGLRAVDTEWILFVDDDIECEPDLVERHLLLVDALGCDASCGITDEVGAGPPPPAFRLVRSSDAFPTCNALARRTAVLAAGGFDLAYDHGPRADRDLGIRLHLGGHHMVLNPLARLLHHHAPRGGLRAQGARVTTYSASRTKPGVRHLPEATELYQNAVYFSPRQVREALAIRVAGTLSTHGSARARATGLALGLLRLPDTLRRIRRVRDRADELRTRYPQLLGDPTPLTDPPASPPGPVPS